MRSMPYGPLSAILFCALLPSAGLAEPPLTMIQDVIYRADGGRFQGSVSIRWNTFTAPDRSTVAKNELTVPVVNGILRVRLVPTTSASPRTYYTVTYMGDGKNQAVEYWSVPQSGQSLRVSDVRSALAADNTYVGIDTQIQIADVVGLADALAVRPVRAVDYVANRVLKVNAAGELESVLGPEEECVRADGSTGPCGSGGYSPKFVDLETPSGTIDGFNTQFLLAESPWPPASLQLYRNGLLLKAGVDYWLSDRSIVFSEAAKPQPGDSLAASYRSLSTEAVAWPGFVDGETPTGAVNSVNTTFVLSRAPSPASSLHLFRNGLLQRQNVDYLIDGSTISFLPSSIPQTGDLLSASYRTAEP